MRSMLLLGVASAISAAAPGRVNAMQFDFTPSNPQYFSGTNCNPSCRVSITTETAISPVQMVINGTVVYDTNNLNPLPSPSQFMGAGTTFGSSHFGDGSTITVTVNAWDNSPTPVEKTKYISAPAYNKAYVLGNSTSSLTDAVTAANLVNARVSSMNHTTRESTTDRKPSILTNLPTYTAFYIDSHGAAGIFGDTQALPASPDSYYLYAQNDPTAASTVTAAVGSKTQSQPPYNFVQVDACDAGNVDATYGSLSSAFKLTGVTDAAYLSWSTGIDDTLNNANWTNVVWQDLANGKTLQSALTDASNRYPPTSFPGAATYSTAGDLNMTLHGTAYGAPTGSWYKSQ